MSSVDASMIKNKVLITKKTQAIDVQIKIMRIEYFC